MGFMTRDFKWRRLVIDTSVLIRHWHNSRAGVPWDRLDTAGVTSWAKGLIELEKANTIVTPVYLEFVGGVGDRRELQLARAYLEPFSIIDKGRISAADWKEARRLAERVPPNRRPRDLGDCLIRAIANRLKYEVRTFDTGMP